MAVRPEPANELSVARSVSTLQALTQASEIRTRSIQLNTARWIDVLTDIIQPGDALVCQAELARASGKALQTRLGVDVQVLASAQEPSPIDWRRAIIFWLIGLGILAGFSLFDFRLVAVLSGTLLKIVLITLVVLELGAFSLWNRIFGFA